MKVELKSEEKSIYKMLCTSCAEAALSDEIIVPDTMEDLEKTLFCRCQCRIREKDVRTNSVFLAGELDVTVFCRRESDFAVCTLSKTLPFELTMDAVGADSTAVAITHISSVSAEAKTVNPRKISISACVKAEQSCYKYTDIRWQSKPDTVPDKLHLKTAELKGKFISFAGEKTLGIEEEFALAPEIGGGELAGAFTDITVTGSEVVGTKLVVRGIADITAVYIASGRPREETFTTEFSQLFSLPEGGTPQVIPIPMITGQYFETYDDKLSADIRAVIQIVCVSETDISYISDAYSCGNMIEAATGDIEYISDMTSAQYEMSTELCYTSERGVEQVLYSQTVYSAPGNDRGKLGVGVCVDAIFLDTGGILRACKLRGKAEVTGAEKPAYFCRVLSGKTGISTDGESIKARPAIILEETSAECREVSAVSEIQMLDTPAERPQDSAYICRCGSENELWDAAKKYHSDAAIIRELNELGDELSESRLLLIPVV